MVDTYVEKLHAEDFPLKWLSKDVSSQLDYVVMRHEFNVVLQILRNNKATSIDNTPTELIKKLWEKTQEKIYKLASE